MSYYDYKYYVTKSIFRPDIRPRYPAIGYPVHPNSLLQGYTTPTHGTREREQKDVELWKIILSWLMIFLYARGQGERNSGKYFLCKAKRWGAEGSSGHLEPEPSDCTEGNSESLPVRFWVSDPPEKGEVTSSIFNL